MRQHLHLYTILVVGALADPLPQTKDVGSPFVVPLTKKKAGSTAGGESPSVENFYVGELHAGGPKGSPESQVLQVIFDVSSGQVVLDSTRCQEETCLMHAQYETKATDIYRDGSLVGSGERGDALTTGLTFLGIGEGTINSDLVKDLVCLDAEHCVSMNLLAATHMTAAPFSQTPFDGVVGLGLEGLSVNPGFNFFGRLLAATNTRPQFALFIDHESAELTLGGYNEARLNSSIDWEPVMQPEAGFWQVRVTAVNIGGAGPGSWTFSDCGWDGCRGTIDTTSSYLGVPPEIHHRLSKDGGVCGRDVNPDIQLMLGDGVTLTLTGEDYVDRSNGQCTSLLYPLGPLIADGVNAFDTSNDLNSTILKEGALGSEGFLLGEPMLRRYYTIFDWDAKRVGFGRAAKPAPVVAKPAPVVTKPKKHQALAGQPYILLVQKNTSVKKV